MTTRTSKIPNYKSKTVILNSKIQEISPQDRDYILHENGKQKTVGDKNRLLRYARNNDYGLVISSITEKGQSPDKGSCAAVEKPLGSAKLNLPI